MKVAAVEALTETAVETITEAEITIVVEIEVTEVEEAAEEVDEMTDSLLLKKKTSKLLKKLA